MTRPDLTGPVQPERPRRPENVVAATPVQRQLWFTDRLAPHSPQNNVALRFWLRGPVSAAALQAALDHVTATHEALRTCFGLLDDELTQYIRPSCVFPLHRLTAGSREAALGLADRLVREPIDLAAAPAGRAALIETEDDGSCLVLVLHHAVADHASLGIIRRELSQAYREAITEGRPASGGPRLQYADYAVWAEEVRRTPEFAAHGTFWEQELAGFPVVVELPADRPRPARLLPDGATHRFRLPAEDAKGVRELARSAGATPFMVYLSVFALVLRRWADHDKLLIGSPVSVRTRQELADVVGPLINTLVFGIDLAGAETFMEVLNRVRRAGLRALAHQEYPFELLVDRLAPPRDLSRSPLVQVSFMLHGGAGEPLALAGVECEQLETDTATAKQELLLWLTSSDDEVDGVIEYATQLFSAASVARLANRYDRLLRQVVAEPNRPVRDLDWVGERDRRTLLDWGRGPQEGDAELVPDRILAVAADTPHRTAVVDREGELGYAELVAQATGLAHRLRHVLSEAGPEPRVGLCLPRDRWLLITMVGAHLAGAAYVPLDPDHPPARLRLIAQDAGLVALVTTVELSALGLVTPGGTPTLLMDDEPEDASPAPPGPLPQTAPDHSAYLMYTSGSTGRPKGVVIEHGSLANVMASFRDSQKITGDDRFLASTSVGFDIAGLELLLPLYCGGQVVLGPSPRVADPEQLLDLASRHGVTVLQATPTLLVRAVRAAAGPVPTLTQVWCGGEALSADAAREVIAWCQSQGTPERRPRLYNLYGPTETTIWSTMAEVLPGVEADPPIGRPLRNTRVYVVDDDLRLVPPGMSGELLIGGAGVARGYWDRPELTADRFVDDVFAGGRLYRTGDIARWGEDGLLRFAGRLDDQVKIHGFRVEPGEIEAALRELPDVRDAAVTVRTGPDGEPTLAAYVVSRHESAPSPQAYRTRLVGKLPTAMIPSFFVALDQLPTTPNGKLNQWALPDPAPPVAGRDLASATATERLLCEIWKDVLAVAVVRPSDDFFLLGGNSLQAVTVLNRIRSRTGVELHLDVVFLHPVLSALAARVDSAPDESGAHPPLTARPRS
ncbi:MULTISPECIES: non-ribosomal peptide synthetase [unclassified Nonomuraea]|uniref:non-ribosomal peptide synthetase n=1 Tax=unclassified Nonomuraea TaxID=2593643 RepID=UPI00137686FF|nr:non-ribosomal peptide synthetase [Nonomuraea sp. KC401]NBE98014.1 amino acid adenylation domain-containing protein [Nonomuraea sp. K271]